MISSQKRDAVFNFNMHQNPLLSLIVDNDWRKETFKNVNIFIPEGAKLSMNTENGDEPSLKFPAERVKEWNDIGIHELLGKFTDLKEADRKDK